jgi:hypothetical protein
MHQPGRAPDPDARQIPPGPEEILYRFDNWVLCPDGTASALTASDGPLQTGA